MSIYLFLMLFSFQFILLYYSLILFGFYLFIIPTVLSLSIDVFIIFKHFIKTSIKKEPKDKPLINPHTNKPFKRFDDIKFYKDDDN